MKLAKTKVSDDWTMDDLEKALKKCKNHNTVAVGGHPNPT